MKRIGIPGYKVGDGFGVALTYLNFAKEISGDGQIHILMPNEPVREDLDLLLLPGGLDVNPSNYGQAPGFYTTNTDVFKQWFCDVKLPDYVDNGTPVFGICLGFQMLNVHFGGSLAQHLIYHEQSPDRWKKAHEVTLTKEGTEMGIFNKQRLDVNSHHHQAVVTNSIAEDLIPIARCSTNHDIIEAFKHRNLPIAGVQWHPEEWYDLLSLGLIGSIIR